MTERSSPCTAEMVVMGFLSGQYHLAGRADNVSSPPTDAELDAAFGTPAEVGPGWLAFLDDNGAGSAVYLVLSDGSNWWYVALTKAS